jgi:GntR family transcriptional regulator, transcriptional repressor for pyruvate dehydrogenase complex
MAALSHSSGRRTVHMKAAELVADEIGASIASGQLRPGERLPSQPELAARYDVSAPTLREALRILETDSLVQVRRGVKGGTFVSAPNLSAMSRQLGLYLQMHGATIADLYAARLALEPPAVRLLAERFAPEIRDELLDALNDLRSALDDREALAAPAARFHALLLERCGNVTFAALGGVVGSIFEKHIATAVRSAKDSEVRALAERTITRHLKLIDLLSSGDGAASERFWRRTLEYQLQFLEEHGASAALVEFY